MKPLALIRNLAMAGALAVAGGAVAQPPPPPPVGVIQFSGGSVAFIAGVHWGGGVVDFRGRRYPVKVSGLNVGAIGADSFRAIGDIYNLYRIEDIQGSYGAINASATVGVGAGAIEMQNGRGVRIAIRSSSAGLKLSLAPSGMDIRLR
jgi:hypothetical protein